MSHSIRIALIGDFNPSVTAHVAIPHALAMADERVEPVWCDTQSCAERDFSSFHGFWCVPASPYRSMEGALRAIRFARENRRPFLGTCGGFQHALIEFARNVVGLRDADHAESNPAAATLLMTPLSCALVEKSETITFTASSRIAATYGASRTTEQYHCSYGLNEQFRPRLEAAGMHFTGFDVDGSVRVAELADHPFFIATLFQPERAAVLNRQSPIVTAFVRASKLSS